MQLPRCFNMRAFLITQMLQIHLAVFADQLNHRAGVQSGRGLGGDVGTEESI